MVLSFLIYIATSFINAILTMGHSIAPGADLSTQFFQYLSQILSITQQALNFMYLIFGETLFIVLPSITALLGIKYLIYPIVQILRSILINSNN